MKTLTQLTLQCVILGRMSGLFTRFFWFTAGVGTGIYLDQTRTWMPRMDNLVRKWKTKLEPIARETASEAIRIYNEETKKLEDDINKNKRDDE
mmetsp:Transcript_29862/g.47644  ORF Transcript_29862/g.47644 Transcript_29862/m.47644 type:complete len:93 (-) Transcript_29862:172-450(-)